LDAPAETIAGSAPGRQLFSWADWGRQLVP
jgi:hypothetical protein